MKPTPERRSTTEARVVGLCGSLRRGSVNAAVLETTRQIAPSGLTVTLYDGMRGLPAFDPDDDREPLPPSVAVLRRSIAEADAVLVCTPEYAGALPGAFKNLLDWTVGAPDMERMPVAWINASGTAAPTAGADAHDSLRKVLGYLNAAIVEETCVRVRPRALHRGRAGPSYASTNGAMVSGRTPSVFIAAAAASPCRAASHVAMSGVSTIRATRFEPEGSRNVRVVMPSGPKYSSRVGEASQWSTSSTSWTSTSVSIVHLLRGGMGSERPYLLAQAVAALLSRS